MKDETNPSVTPETMGQNGAWPGEKLKKPGVYNKVKGKVGDMTHVEETVLPEMPNHSVPTDPA